MTYNGKSKNILSQQRENLDAERAAEGVDIEKMVRESRREAEDEAKKFVVIDEGDEAKSPLLSAKQEMLKKLRVEKDRAEELRK